MKTSIASLKERLADWIEWDGAAYHLGACLGFWPEYGAPPGHDNWHGYKGVVWSSEGDELYHFLDGLVTMGLLERKEEPDIAYRWNPNYKGDISSF